MTDELQYLLGIAAIVLAYWVGRSLNDWLTRNRDREDG